MENSRGSIGRVRPPSRRRSGPIRALRPGRTPLPGLRRQRWRIVSFFRSACSFSLSSTDPARDRLGRSRSRAPRPEPAGGPIGPSILPRDGSRDRKSGFRTARSVRGNRSNRRHKCRAPKGCILPIHRAGEAAAAAVAFSRSRAPRPAKLRAGSKRQGYHALSFFHSTSSFSHGCPNPARLARTTGPAPQRYACARVRTTMIGSECVQ